MVVVTCLWMLKLYCKTALRFGDGSTNDHLFAAPEFDILVGSVASAANRKGKCPWPGLFRSISAPFGAVWRELSANMYERGSTSNSPIPPRTDVLPSWNGSQAKPTRGSKFFNVGLSWKV